MATDNTNLNIAKVLKYDELFTQYQDIEKELSFYDLAQFENKIIFCNCDDFYNSNFTKFFNNNFEKLKLKKVISLSLNGNLQIRDNTQVITDNIGNGDFRSNNSIKYLLESDIVITNPPFSLLRDFIIQLMKYKKDFLFIGNMNCLTYRNIFKYVKSEKIKKGAKTFNNGLWFILADKARRETSVKILNNKKCVNVSGAVWLTNLNHSNITKPLLLKETYSQDKYKKLNNYDAINCNSYKDIPTDYYQNIAIPISFLNVHCSSQFKIIDYVNCPIVDNKKIYKRLIIKRVK